MTWDFPRQHNRPDNLAFEFLSQHGAGYAINELRIGSRLDESIHIIPSLRPK